MKTIVLIGDSIRMAYEATVREALAGEAEVVSPRENGGNSDNVLSRLDEWVLAVSPALVHLNCGLHDIKKPFDTQEPAVPIDRYESNLHGIFKRILDSGAGLVWAATTPVNQDRHHAVKGFDRYEQDVRDYNAAAARVAAAHGVAVHDLYTLIMQAGRDGQLGADGVHFTAEGSRLLGKAVADFVRPRLR